MFSKKIRKALLRSTKTAERTRVKLVRPLAVFLDLSASVRTWNTISLLNRITAFSTRFLTLCFLKIPMIYY